MNRNEKYQFLRSMGLSSDLARKWRDRKIEQVETKDINNVLKNNPELRRDYNNYISRLRYNFLREIGLSAERARTLRKHKKIDVKNLSLRNNKIVKNRNYFKLLEQIKKEYPKIYALTLEPEVKAFVKKYKNVENYGVYTKWGTLTRIEPYKHETNKLVGKIKEVFGANTKQSFYLLYLMYEYGQTFDQIFDIIATDPLWEIYAKEGR
ncbi:MAG: hypothetical protein QW042_04990 [Thermoplasmata archaeon]